MKSDANSETAKRIEYRPDIDGLRSVAILGVLLYHAGIRFLPGGFVGVDVFFVISGFLITSIISQEISSGSFSLNSFYKRRTLRIIPLLFVVLMSTTLSGYLTLLPTEFKDLGVSTVAAAAFSSNIYFWLTSDYFAAPADTLPLLHTWSLAVEEQFYLIFPIILISINRLAGKIKVSFIILLTAASFLFSLIFINEDASGAFYLLPSRAWELGIGATLALQTRFRSERSSNALATVGILLILSSFIFISDSMRFPGTLALAPVIGAGLLIFAGQNSWVGNNVLSTRPFVFVGKISYALYLWHWPVIVFYKLNFGELSASDTVTVIVISFVLAVVSRSAIELPFLALRRKPSFLINIAGVAALSVCGCFGLFFYKSNIAADRFSPNVAAIAAYTDYESTPDYLAQFRSGTCFIESENDGVAEFSRDKCLALSSSKPNVLLIGDSHAADLWAALQKEMPQINLLQATASGCRPLVSAVGEERCTKLVDYIFSDFLPATKLDGIILAGRWRSQELPAVIDTVATIRRFVRNVAVIGPTVEYEPNVPSILAREIISGDPIELAPYADKSRFALDDLMQSRLKDLGIGYISIAKTICVQGTCKAEAAPGVPLQFDYGHFTNVGADWVAEQIAGPLEGILDVSSH